MKFRPWVWLTQEPIKMQEGDPQPQSDALIGPCLNQTKGETSSIDI